MEEKEIVLQVCRPIYEAKGWMKLLGMASIILGVFSALTIIGLLWCWLPIWMGILLFKAGSTIEFAQSTGNKIPLIESLEKIKLYFIINGVLMLLAIILFVIMFFISGLAFLSGMSAYT